ncbi:disease resistance-like protein DSC1 isoform X1 [Mangifera indica]|uniref:disease resistance-like protein DSC1 isoform X1 n=1 Tax=Mangifera indica TaxID=29780 RepID=UPI001CFA209B|nr:disease resistance-like protein DSC1 isoform X1 [Mangifera indica]XP_044469275.1 disease resistance-like protein DSC1 isoform X1 [Mangifera indica]XP_044469276.1 disease resistance-like protein DSC1 isoform X1 [Mangifera indica]XP_044469277.1 disease resistance-like protein DSC1 isoform X1 [Mangifera indica]
MPNSKVEKLWTGNQVYVNSYIYCSFSLQYVCYFCCFNSFFFSQKLVNLKYIDLSNAKHLRRMPNFSLIPNLESLILQGCTKLDRLPNDMENLRALEKLEMDDIALAEIPVFIKGLVNLKALSLARCKVQMRSSISLTDLLVLQKMESLNLVDCCIKVLTNNIGQFLSLEYLYLNQNNFESLPVSIKDLSKLRGLYLNNCQRLKSLPELPINLLYLQANNCTSLESISSLLASFLSFRYYTEEIGFVNCSKLQLDLTDLLLIIERKADEWRRSKVCTNPIPQACVCYPGSEIPNWFGCKSNDTFIELPTGWLNDNLIGFVLCVVVPSQEYQQLRISRVRFSFIVNGEISFVGTLFESKEMKAEVIQLDHVFVGYANCIFSWELQTFNLNSQGVIEFSVETMDNPTVCWVKKCGVTLLYAKDDDDDLRREGRMDRDKRLKTGHWYADNCLACYLGSWRAHRNLLSYFSEKHGDRWSPIHEGWVSIHYG